MNKISTSKIHGIISFAILDLAIVISIFAIAKTSLLQATIYFVGSSLSGLAIIFVFCTKCLSKNNCSHVLPGQLTRFSPNRSIKNYKTIDYLITVVAVAYIFLYPQIWLWKFKLLFIAFWIILIGAIFQINKYVCTSCSNSKCAMCKKHVN